MSCAVLAATVIMGCAHAPLPKTQARSSAAAPPAKPKTCDSVATCESACKDGGVEACGSAVVLMHQHPLDTDPRRLAAVLSISCDQRVAESCNRLAELLISSPILPRDEARSKSLYRKSCDLQNAIGCLSLGPALQESETPHAMELLQKGCAAHDGGSCALLGGMAMATDPRKSQLYAEQAATYFESSCLGGHSDECVKGAMQLSGPQGTGNQEQAIRLLRAGCDARRYDACTYLSTAIQSPSVKDALLDKACDGGREDACLVRAIEYQDKQSAGDATHAKTLVAKGIALAKAHCDLGDSSGCVTLAKSLSFGAMTDEETRKTADYLEITCDRHLLLSCNELADQVASGPQAIRDEARSVRLKKRSCELGYPFACPDPMAVLGIERPVTWVIFDRSSGLEWAPVARDAALGLPKARGGFDIAGAACRGLDRNERTDWRLPKKKELLTLFDDQKKLRTFAARSLPHQGSLFSGESTKDGPITVSLLDGSFASTMDGIAIPRCVRKAETGRATSPTFTLHMTSEGLEVELLDLKQKVVSRSSIPKPKEAMSLSSAWDPQLIDAPVDVEASATVDWSLMTRFADELGQRGVPVLRLIVQGKE